MKSIDQALLASLDLVFAQDLDGRFIYINEVTARVFGGDRHQLINNPLTATTLPLDIIEHLSASHREILNSGRPNYGEIQLPDIYHQGKKDYEYTVSPVKRHHGKVEATVFIAKDITERKRAEIAVSESEAKYRSLFEAASDAILILEASTYRIVNANWAAACKLGYSRKELLQLSIQNIELQSDEKQRVQIIQQIEMDGDVTYEQYYRRKNGSTFPVEINAQLIEYEDQFCIQSFVRDITERKQSEEALRQQKQQLESIAANLPGVIYREVVQPDGTVSLPYISEGTTQFSGLTPQQIMENPRLMLDSTHPDDRPHVEAQLYQCRQTLQPLDVEYRDMHLSGDMRWMREIARFSQNDNGDIVADGIALDISDLKEAQIALEQQLEQERLLRRNIEHIHQSLDLSTILQATADNILTYLQSERVIICRFNPDWSSELLIQAVCQDDFLITEPTLPNCPSIDEDYIERYQQRHHIVVDDIDNSGLTCAFVNFWKQFQVRSHIIIPILAPSNDPDEIPSPRLWGLLIAHQCSHPREWKGIDIDFIKQLATQTGIAIYQSELLSRLQVELQERTRAEQEVRALNAELEQRVQERTVALRTTNNELIQEIGDRIQIEEALRQSETRFRNLVETTHDLIWEENDRGLISYVSPQSVSILGYTPEEMIGHSVLEFMVPDQHRVLRQNSTALDAGQIITNLELQFLHKDGHQVILESRQISLFDNAGNCIGRRGIDRDITERKRDEATLQKYERIVSATQDSISLIDRNYIYQIVNQTYLDRMAQKVEEVVGYSIDELFSQDICEQFARPKLDRCFSGEVVQYEDWFEFPAIGPRYISVNYSPYVELDGSISGAVVSSRDITQLKQAEDALAESEHRYASLIEAVPIGIFRDDIVSSSVYVNDRYCQITGISPEEATTDHWQQQIHPDDRDRVSELWSQVLQSHCPYSLEYRYQHRDGTVIWIYEETVPERNVNGQVIGYVGTIMDISDRKQAEQKLATSEARLSTLINALPFGVWVRDAGDRLILQNPADVARYGDLIGTHVDDLPLLPDVLAEYWSVKQRCQQGEVVSRETIEIVEGEEHAFLRIATALSEPDGCMSMLGVAIDITKRKQSEQALRLLADVVSSSNDAIITKTLDGIITSWNHTATTLFGYSETEAIGQPLSILFPADRISEHQEVIDRIRRGERVDSFETIRLRKDGTLADVSINISPLKDEAGQVVGASTIVRDITARKRAEQALLETESQLRQIFEHIEDVFFLKETSSGQVIFQNSSWSRLSKQPAHVAYDDPDAWLDCIHPDDYERVVTAAQQQKLGEGGFGDMEYRIVHADGSIRWVWNRTFPIRNEANQIYRFAGINTDITERKHADLALYASEERRRLALELTNTGSWELNLETKESLWSDSQYRLLGLEPRQSKSCESTWRTCVHHDDLEQAEQAFQAALDTHTQFESEYRVVDSDGTIRWVMEKGHGIYNEANKPVRAVGVLIDINDRKQAEKALQESQQFLQTVLNALPLYVFWKDRHSVYMGCNDKFAKAAGLATPESIIGKTDYDLPWAKTEADSYRADDREVMERSRAKLESLETQFQANGDLIFVETNKFPVYSLADQVVGVLGTYEDITERRKVEAAMRLKLEATETATDGIGILQGDIYLYLNRAHLDLFGYASPEELVGKSWKLLYSQEELIRFEHEIFPALRKSIAWHGQVTATRKDGSTFLQQLSLSGTNDGLFICVCRQMGDRPHARD
ncbi:MAG: PAS domain S-box protein [Cyanobacteria bacterium P01_A01_bin.37]